MTAKSSIAKKPAEQVLKDSRRATRWRPERPGCAPLWRSKGSQSKMSGLNGVILTWLKVCDTRHFGDLVGNWRQSPISEFLRNHSFTMG